MSTNDLYELNFRWPNTFANEVIVTGTFDQWSSSIRMKKTATGFVGSARVAWSEKVSFKFVVDGQWTTSSDHPTEVDSAGNVNNVVTAPSKPAPPVVESPPAVLAPEAVNPTPKDTTTTEAPKTNGLAVSDIVDTVVAKEGTKDALSYVASGVGAAIKGAIGVDPVNPKQVPLDTKPKVEEVAETIPNGINGTVGSTTTEKPATPTVAPIVPIDIVPVNVNEVQSTTSVTSQTAMPNGASTHEPLSTSATSPSPSAPVDAKAAVAASPVPAPAAPAPAATPAPPVASDTPATPPTTNPTSTTTNGTNGNTTPPTTPKKQAFPRSSTDSPTSSLRGSPGSRFSTTSRKKRDSIFGKIKHIFAHDKDKDEKKEKAKAK